MNHPTAQPTTRGDFYRLMSTIANHRPELYSLASEAERRYVAYPALLAALKRIIELADDPENEKDSDLVDIIDWDHIRRTIAQAESEG